MSASINNSRMLERLIADLRRHVLPAAALVPDSRHVDPGDVFLAYQGRTVDGRDFIAQAVARGAAAVVYETELTLAQRASLGNVPAYPLEDLQARLGLLAHRWWNCPSDTVRVIAITGTNGKTTTSQWLGAALRAAGHPCAVIGTLGVIGVRGEPAHDATLTTPDAVSLHRQIARMRDDGAEYVVLEASSIGLDQGRMDALAIHAAIFTNLTQDHLDYHQDMQAYGRAKARLFAVAGLKHAIINADDPAANVMVQSCRAPVVRFGMDAHSQLQWLAQDVRDVHTGTEFVLKNNDHQVAVSTPFIGRHNVSNLLAVAAALGCLEWSFEQIVAAIAKLPPVAGRMEPVTASETAGTRPLVFVDYAHTPDALTHVLRSVRGLAQVRGGKVWCVAGCGGDRDSGKRAPMGVALSLHADRFIVTSDNPRGESPQAIVDDIWSGVSSTERGLRELNREIAILSVIWQAAPDDVIVIAGKGHETWQQTGSIKRYFDDRQWARLGLLYYGQTQWDSVPEVVIDSRRVHENAMFVAIRGERYDAHQFLGEVARTGACCALVSSPAPGLEIPQIVVDDTRKALQSMATAWRRRFDLPVIAVTGSNGKTTTKEMVAAILMAWVGHEHSLSTQGNLNNELGVPLTVLRLRPWHKAAVIELGMNHPGEIALLSAMVDPTVALVLNAQREHQEFMVSVEAVAQENGQVLTALSEDGAAVYMDQPPYSALWADLSRHVIKRWQFGMDAHADVFPRDLETDPLESAFTLCTPQGSQAMRLAVPGVHNVLNALASAACALCAGASLENVVQGLSNFSAVKGRMQLHRLSGDRVLIDDTYNANPDSVRAAVDVLRTLASPRVLVLGDMGEVGDQGPQMHREIGRYARDHQIDHLWTLGSATTESVTAFGSGAIAFESLESLVEHVLASDAASMLVKGSRFMAMERVVQAVLTRETSMSNNNNDREQRHAG